MTLIIDCFPFHCARSYDALASQVRRGQVVDIKETITSNINTVQDDGKLSSRSAILGFWFNGAHVPISVSSCKMTLMGLVLDSNLCC
ncbi:hypothetical protein BGAL_0252g00090 [Botrytis galanthina]|uniref:Uncharacterized protein n=1 Tax=Botrytis galanthina TaxID=278940 RepID=A0A4S8QT11_9HELO|nr:hypothetical protein BGAL_0252g00090 [Botrytis galanthina]